MQRVLWLITVILLFAGTTTAQEDNPIVCQNFATAPGENEPAIMRVNETQISAGSFANRLRFEHAYNAIKYEIRVTQLNAIAQENQADAAMMVASDAQIQQINLENEDLTQLGNRILSDLASDAVIWAYATENQITVRQRDVFATIDDFFGITEETMDERQRIIDDFSQRILTNGTPPDQITTFFCRQTLYDAVQAQVIDPTETTTYVDAEHILVNSEAVATDIITLLQAGDDFATLARELSLDIPSAERGGALGWQPALLFVPNFTIAVLTGELDTLLGPVQTGFGWHVIRVNAREERPITEETRPVIESTRFTRWRGDQINQSDIAINPDWQSFIPEL